MKRNTEKVFGMLKELFSLTKENFAEAKLADGSTLRSDSDLIQGAKVSLVGADGTVTDAPDGDLVLEDGTKVTIKGGVIDTMVAAEAAPVEATATDTVEPAKMEDAPAVEAAPAETTEAPAEEAKEATDLGMLTDLVNQLTERLAAVEAQLGESMAATTEMKSQVEKFSKEPAATAIKRTDVTEEVFSANKPNDYLSKIEELAFGRNKK